MLSKTLQDGLATYSIGSKIRTLRLKKKMGLVELGTHTDLSPALLSKIETGKLFPTLPTLLRIAMTFSVGLEHFFTPDDKGPVLAMVRRGERQRFPDTTDSPDVSFHFESLDFPANDRRLNAFYAEFHPLAATKVRPHHPDGVELLYVLRGSVEVRFGGEERTLEEGDAIYFDASVPHGYRRIGKNACAAIVVTTR